MESKSRKKTFFVIIIRFFFSYSRPLRERGNFSCDSQSTLWRWPLCPCQTSSVGTEGSGSSHSLVLEGDKSRG